MGGLSGEFEGVGVEMATRDGAGQPCDTISDACRLVITRVVRRSPAVAAGLRGETVTAGPSTDHGKALADIVPTIRGPKGTVVTLTIVRGTETLDVPVTRDVIQREDVTSQVLANGRVGYLKISGFSSGSAQDLHDLLTELIQTQHVEALILDLRDDPGGYVDAAQKIASEFTAADPLYWEQSATGAPEPQHPMPEGAATDPALPMVVLVNGGTASASEIVSAALQGNHRALLIGSQTYGKGTIQEFKKLPGAGGYRLSVASGGARPDVDPRRRPGAQCRRRAAGGRAAAERRRAREGHLGPTRRARRKANSHRGSTHAHAGAHSFGVIPCAANERR
jgi:carboxyl-terminal processing protease